jgi:hypothetical protein
MHDGAEPEFATFRTSPHGRAPFTFTSFGDQGTPTARKRPWMPSAGNHENELGNGPIGYQAYQTYFSVPEVAGQTEVTRGLWYAFTAGSRAHGSGAARWHLLKQD